MILVRPFADDDLPTLQAMHAAQGFGYEAPDWGKLLVSCVLEVDGKVEMAAFLRKTSEAYLLTDPATSARKRDRLQWLGWVQKEMAKAAKRVDLVDTHVWIPPVLEEKKFGRLLMHLGWERPLWNCYSYTPKV